MNQKIGIYVENWSKALFKENDFFKRSLKDYLQSKINEFIQDFNDKEKEIFIQKLQNFLLEYIDFSEKIISKCEFKNEVYKFIMEIYFNNFYVNYSEYELNYNKSNHLIKLINQNYEKVIFQILDIIIKILTFNKLFINTSNDQRFQIISTYLKFKNLNVINNLKRITQNIKIIAESLKIYMLNKKQDFDVYFEQLIQKCFPQLSQFQNQNLVEFIQKNQFKFSINQLSNILYQKQEKRIFFEQKKEQKMIQEKREFLQNDIKNNQDLKESKKKFDFSQIEQKIKQFSRSQGSMTIRKSIKFEPPQMQDSQFSLKRNNSPIKKHVDLIDQNTQKKFHLDEFITPHKDISSEKSKSIQTTKQKNSQLDCIQQEKKYKYQESIKKYYKIKSIDQNKTKSQQKVKQEHNQALDISDLDAQQDIKIKINNKNIAQESQIFYNQNDQSKINIQLFLQQQNPQLIKRPFQIINRYSHSQ